MSTQITFGRRLAAVLIPTPFQAFICLVLALAILIGAHAHLALALIGIDDSALSVSRVALHGRFETVLASPISQTVALATFWAGVGLVAYLVCWIGFSLFTSARNELTLTTAYTNRGHWWVKQDVLMLKVLSALVLFVAIVLFKPGLALWLAIVGGLIAAPSIATGLYSLGAILGLASQLYLILALALVTFTPWYREETFTAQSI
jgi:hypothetical protein